MVFMVPGEMSESLEKAFCCAFTVTVVIKGRVEVERRLDCSSGQRGWDEEDVKVLNPEEPGKWRVRRMTSLLLGLGVISPEVWILSRGFS